MRKTFGGGYPPSAQQQYSQAMPPPASRPRRSSNGRSRSNSPAMKNRSHSGAYDDLVGSRQRGICTKWVHDGAYGFLLCHGLPNLRKGIFFHKRSVDKQYVRQWEYDNPQHAFQVDVGMEAEFTLMKSTKHLGEYEAATVVFVDPDEAKSQRQSHQNEKQLLYGTVSSLQPKYGFLYLSKENNERIPWVHATPNKVFFFRDTQFSLDLNIGDTLSFEVCQRNTIGTVAINLTTVRPEKMEAENCFFRGTKVKFEENQTVEFKSLANAKDPAQSFGFLINKYGNAFLNGRGGKLFGGIEDDGTVTGLQLNRKGRDKCGQYVGNAMVNMQPPVDPRLYDISFVPVVESFNARAHDVLPLHDMWVIVLEVREGRHPRPYMNSDRKCFVKHASSVYEMTPDMIADHIKRYTSVQSNKQNNVQEEKVAMMEAQMNSMAELMQQLQQPQSQVPATPNPDIVQLNMQLIEQITSMGFPKDQVVAKYFSLQAQHKSEPVTAQELSAAMLQ